MTAHTISTTISKEVTGKAEFVHDARLWLT